MPDFYVFPFLARIFYLKNSELNRVYESLNLPEKYPNLQKWFELITSQSDL